MNVELNLEQLELIAGEKGTVATPGPGSLLPSASREPILDID
jgi:hypothetical protein